MTPTDEQRRQALEKLTEWEIATGDAARYHIEHNDIKGYDDCKAISEVYKTIRAALENTVPEGYALVPLSDLQRLRVIAENGARFIGAGRHRCDGQRACERIAEPLKAMIAAAQEGK